MRTTTTPKRYTGRRPSERHLTRLNAKSLSAEQIEQGMALIVAATPGAEHVEYPRPFHVGAEAWTACLSPDPVRDADNRTCAILTDYTKNRVVIYSRIDAHMREFLFQLALDTLNEKTARRRM